MNLYGFCGNNGVNRWDYLGMHDHLVGMDAADIAADDARARAAEAAARQYLGQDFFNIIDAYRFAGLRASDYRNYELIAAASVAASAQQQLLWSIPNGSNSASQFFSNNPSTSSGSQSVTSTIFDSSTGEVIDSRTTSPVGVAPKSAATTTTVQILGRPIPSDPTGSLHASVVVTNGSQSVLAQAQPSRKLSGLDEFLNVFGVDRGVTIQPIAPTPTAQSYEYRLYTAADARNFLATYESPVLTIHRPFDEVVNQINQFNRDLLEARVSYLASTQNSNSYAFNLARLLTGTSVSPSAEYQIPGSNTQLNPPPASGASPQGR